MTELETQGIRLAYMPEVQACDNIEGRRFKSSQLQPRVKFVPCINALGKDLRSIT